MVEHKVIGLISGGKDSCFSLLHCAANGHEIIALATLTPETGIDELDSHLYQSVGTTVPPLIARCMGVPHYSRIIKGKAVEQGPEYGDRVKGGQGSGVEGDETEDLYLLLQDVLVIHPDATAIATGAILSTYQRLRIEHVCGRLGLISLSYLWQAEQMPLLDQMKACGMDVVLVKVAGVGLGQEMVGASLWDQLPTLRKLERLYGSHPAGEGGEYETLTLDSPLFSHSISLKDTEVIVSDPEPNLVAYLRTPHAELVHEPDWVRPTVPALRAMLGLAEEGDVMGVLDQQGRAMLEEIGPLRKKRRVEASPGSGVAVAIRDFTRLRFEDEAPSAGGATGTDTDAVSFSRRGRWFTISTSQATTEEHGDVGGQVRGAFLRIQAHLELTGLSLLQGAHITLFLPSMSLFPLANKAYSTFFGTSPPSRATVAVPLPLGVGVRLEVMGYDDRATEVAPTSPSDRRPGGKDALGVDEISRSDNSASKRRRVGGRTALHVQSLSYWAPANIGPYSQAITVNERVQIAGQVPLIPSTLELPPSPPHPLSPYPAQCALALQHVRKVIEVLRSPNSTGGGWTGWVESVTAWWALPPAQHSLEAQGDGDESEGGEAVEVITRAWSIWAEEFGCDKAPLLVVEAKELPRGALVEFQVNLHTGRRPPVGEDGKREPVSGTKPVTSASQGGKDDIFEDEDEDDDDDDDDDELEGIYTAGEVQGIRWERCQTSGRAQRGSRAMLFVECAADFDIASNASATSQLQAISSRAISAKVFHLQSLSEHQAHNIARNILPDIVQGFTPVPVFEIHDRSGRSADLALEVFGG